MKKLLITLASVLSINTVYALPYTQEIPDCSHDKTFLSVLSKDGFSPILEFKDNFGVSYFLLNNFKKTENALVSVKEGEEKVCLVFLGNDSSVNVNMEGFRDFLDTLVKDSK